MWLAWLLASFGLLGWQGAATNQSCQEVFAHLKAGSDHLQRGEAGQAIRELKAAVALDPQSAAGHMLLGQAYLAQRSLGLVAEAKAELQQALDLDPSLLWAHFYLAKACMDLGRNDKAKEELERGLEMRPNVPHFLSLVGEVHRKLGKPELALEMNRKALEADPAMTPAHYYMALAWMDLKKSEEAIRELESSVQSPYVAPEMYLTLGSQYFGRRKYREAEEVVRKGIALDPTRPEGRLNLAQLYNVQGWSDRALAELKRAIPEGKSFPTSAYYQQVLADVAFETGKAYQAKRLAQPAIQACLRTLEFDPNRGQAHRAALLKSSFSRGITAGRSLTPRWPRSWAARSSLRCVTSCHHSLVFLDEENDASGRGGLSVASPSGSGRRSPYHSMRMCIWQKRGIAESRTVFRSITLEMIPALVLEMVVFGLL